MGERRIALVTGASSGIGRACTHALDERDWRVYAGVRHDADARALAQDNSPSVRPVRLDVTVASSRTAGATLRSSTASIIFRPRDLVRRLSERIVS